jgi:hypothetical protein
MPPDRENLSVAVRIRADRTLPGGVAIVGALTEEAVVDNQASRIAVVAIALLEEAVSEAVKRGNKVAVAVRAVRACLQEVEAEAVEAVAVVAAVVVGAPVAVAAVGADRNRQAA